MHENAIEPSRSDSGPGPAGQRGAYMMTATPIRQIDAPASGRSRPPPRSTTVRAPPGSPATPARRRRSRRAPPAEQHQGPQNRHCAKSTDTSPRARHPRFAERSLRRPRRADRRRCSPDVTSAVAHATGRVPGRLPARLVLHLSGARTVGRTSAKGSGAGQWWQRCAATPRRSGDRGRRRGPGSSRGRIMWCGSRHGEAVA